MIVRIKLNQLEKRSNDYFYNDTPFNGEAYDHRDNQLYQVYEITDGIITGSRDYGALQADGMIKIDYDLLTSAEYFDYEMNQIRCYYQGQPFTGLYYNYSSGFLLSEGLCIDGWVVKNIVFFPDGTGRIRKYEENDIDITETTGDREWLLEWENNVCKRIESRYLDYAETDHSGNLELYFNEQKQIEQVIIKDDYAYVSLLVPRDDLGIDFKTFDDLLAKQDIFADNLSIWSIEDSLFNQWLDRGLLNQVKQLELYKTKIELSTIARLAELPSLQTLKCKEASIYQTDLVRAEKQKQQYRAQALALFALQQNSNIKITFNDGRIDYFQAFLPDDLKQQLT
ncbi:hypothetical protein A9G24_03370 [Gilliamella sp. App6-5]|uniref:hypothetical protein n=2 Tax=Gilliamella sp. App6-5 TaxID=3120232 RepID=UPI00080DF3A2|nr:hypothetical protein [Gilliamella apicola]OCG17071.1 hypothetical protein A9G24_03370 [Gilliamella apicola]